MEEMLASWRKRQAQVSKDKEAAQKEAGPTAVNKAGGTAEEARMKLEQQQQQAKRASKQAPTEKQAQLPPAKQLKLILEWLENRPRDTPFHMREIRQELDLNVIHPPLLVALKGSGKILWDGTSKQISYRAATRVRDRAQLEDLLAEAPHEGVSVNDLKDSYYGAEDDVTALTTEGRCWRITNSEIGTDLLYGRPSPWSPTPWWTKMSLSSGARRRFRTQRPV